MKKAVSLIIVLSLALVVFSGCAKTADTVKTGLAVVSSVAKSTDAGEKEGLAEADSTVVAVTVDKDGKIVKCVIDTAQTKVNFTTEGKITTDFEKEFKSKQELKTDYGMLKASGINKEWNEQADAFAAYCVGKTAAEVQGIAVSEGYPAEAELKASVTMHITDFIDAVVKAVNNASDLGAKSTDKLGLGLATVIDSSKDATAEKAGLAQVDTTYAAVTFAADGKITSSIIESSQSKVNFDLTGKITSDLTAALKTKTELKEDYGMKARSGIGKEWYEQAAAFAKYVVGKTAAEVKGIAISEGYPSDAELKASVTIHITDFLTVVEKAGNNAK